MPPLTAYRSTPTPRAARVTAPAVAVAAALALTACTGDAPPAPDAVAAASPTAEPSAPQAEPSSDPTPSGTQSPEAPESTAPEQPDLADAPAYPLFDEHTDRALQTIAAMEANLGAGAFKIDGNGDGTEWKLELARGNQRLKVKVETDDTGLNHRGIDTDDLDDEDRDALDSTQISLSDAIARVVESTNGVLDKAELEEDDGAAFWEITVHTGDDDEDYRVDLATGAITHDD